LNLGGGYGVADVAIDRATNFNENMYIDHEMKRVKDYYHTPLVDAAYQRYVYSRTNI
jgi:hypothetical protein